MELVFIVVSNQLLPNLPTSVTLGPQQVVIVSPVLMLRPKHVPTQFSFAVTIGLRGFDISATTPPKLHWKIVAPNGQEIFDSPIMPLQSPSLIPEGIELLPPEEANIILGLNIQNLDIPEQGNYKIIVYVDDKEIGSQNVPVRVQPKNTKGFDANGE